MTQPRSLELEFERRLERADVIKWMTTLLVALQGLKETLTDPEDLPSAEEMLQTLIRHMDKGHHCPPPPFGLESVGRVFERADVIKWMTTMLEATRKVHHHPEAAPDPEQLLQALIKNIEAGDHIP